ncbi:MAG: LemA family protein [Bacteroidales bacterium]|nr:LemA family protein [Bacteroidales bacterium]
MKKKFIPIIIVAAIVVILVAWGVSVYNGLVTKDENCSNQWSKVESQYQRRMDLIPNLVNTVKGYASHEEATLLKVIEARNQASQVKVDAENMTQEQLNNFQQTQDNLSSAIRGLNIVVEQYPDLKANQNFLELQSQLEGTENRIAVERQRYSDVVNEYNTSVRRFPNSVFASMFGFDKKPYFEAQSGAENAPKVEF